MHLKRQSAPKTWPVYRKGTKYIVRPSSSLSSSIPLLVVLRDMLQAAQNRKEAKRAIFLKHILVNGKTPRDEKTPILLFDTISIVPTGRSYSLDLSEKGKFELKDIKETGNLELSRKIAKIADKKMLKGKKIQLNLQDGGNIISNIKCNTNDSVIINVKSQKIEKCLALSDGSKVVVFSGKYSGKRGKITSIDKENKIVEIEADNKEKFSVLIKQIIVVE